MKLPFRLLFAFVSLGLTEPVRALNDNALQRVIAGADDRRDTTMRAQLARPYPAEGCWHYEDLALAAYWLNQRIEDADKAILAEREKEFPASLKEGNLDAQPRARVRPRPR